MKRLLPLCLVALLTACAPVIIKPAPGVATAQLNDRLVADDDETNSRVFAIREIDGVRVRNAIDNQHVIGFGAAAGVLPWLVARDVEAKMATFLISGKFVTRAPIDALVRSVAGKYQSVEGRVDFTPRADRIYRVNGVLSASDSAVWIEDFDTGEVVSEKVVAPST